MKTYFSDIIPRIQNFSQKLDNLTLLTNQHWVVIDDLDKTKNVYIFRANNELLISQNGKVEKAKWEYLGHNSLLIDRKDESYLFKHGFFDENILALKIDSKEEYAFLVNESKFEKELNSLASVVEFLNKKYIQDPTGISLENNQTTEQLNYIAPKYTIIDKCEDYSLWEGTQEIFTIEYEDGKKGVIYLRKKSKQAYFKMREYWVTYRCLYNNWDNCINALNYFLNTNKLLETGFRGQY